MLLVGTGTDRRMDRQTDGQTDASLPDPAGCRGWGGAARPRGTE